MTYSPWPLLFTFGGVLLVSCGSTSKNEASASDGTGAGGAQNGTGGAGATGTSAVDPDRQAACEALAVARCQRLEACHPIEFAAEYPDQTICAGLEARTCIESLGATDPGATELANCAAELTHQSCEEWFAARVEGVQDSTPSCALFGDREATASCREDWQCASGVCRNYCYDLAEEGEGCQGFATCGAGQRCVAVESDDGATGECRPPLGEGDACAAESSACVYPLACVEGVCAEPVMGASCSWNTFTCGQAWGTGYCDTNPGGEGVCVETHLVVEGERCGQAAFCDVTSYCSTSDASVFGICVARPKVGESCEQAFNAPWPVCEAGAECQGNVCAWVL